MNQENEDMKRLGILLITMIAMATLAGCGSTAPGPEVTPNTAETIEKLATGPSSAESGNDNLGVQLGGSYMGDVANERVEATASRNTSSSTSGPILKGFSMGGVENGADAVEKAIASDPLIVAITAELAKTDTTPARRDALMTQLAAHLASIRSSVVRMGGDLSALTHLTVTNVSTINTGADPKALTDAESKAAGAAIPAIIDAAKGNAKAPAVVAPAAGGSGGS